MIINVNTFKSTIAIVKDSYLYRGSSSSPSKCFVVDVDGDYVSYTCYPYRTVNKEHIRYFLPSVDEGTRTKIKQLRNAKAQWERGDKWAFFTEWMDEELLYLSELAGGKIPSAKHHYTEAQRVKAFISCQIPNVDPWSTLESCKGFAHSVSSMSFDNVLEVSLCRGELQQMVLPDGFTLERWEEQV